MKTSNPLRALLATMAVASPFTPDRLAPVPAPGIPSLGPVLSSLMGSQAHTVVRHGWVSSGACPKNRSKAERKQRREKRRARARNAKR